MSPVRALGYRFCLQQLGLAAWPLRCESRLGLRRETREESGRRVQLFPPLLAVSGEGESAIPAHLDFALRHEGVDLAAMAAVCAAMDPRPLAAWISGRPSSRYARKLGFLYEWLTGRSLPVDVSFIGGAYEPVLDSTECFTGPPRNNARWHVRDNLPGTPAWCPTVHRHSRAGDKLGQRDVLAELSAARAQVGKVRFAQSLAAALVAEIQASYALVGERASPVQELAWGRLLKSAGEVPLHERLQVLRLIQLQGALFRGESHAPYGLRSEERFLSTRGTSGYRRIEYPCPPPRALSSLLEGLVEAAKGLEAHKVPAPVRAGVLSFGFGFLQPLSAGNTRIQRFLIQAALASGRIRSSGVIPVSEVMWEWPQDYGHALQDYQGPLCACAQALAGIPVLLEPQQSYAFPGYERIAPLYQYPVLTEQVAYLEKALGQGIEIGITAEAHWLHGLEGIRSQLAHRLRLPQPRVDFLLRLIRQQAMESVRTHFPQLEESSLREAEEAVRASAHARLAHRERGGRRVFRA